MDITLRLLLFIGAITVLVSYSRFKNTEDEGKKSFYQATGFVGLLIFLLMILTIANII